MNANQHICIDKCHLLILERDPFSSLTFRKMKTIDEIKLRKVPCNSHRPQREATAKISSCFCTVTLIYWNLCRKPEKYTFSVWLLSTGKSFLLSPLNSGGYRKLSWTRSTGFKRQQGLQTLCFVTMIFIWQNMETGKITEGHHMVT